MIHRDITSQLVHITYRTHGSISSKDLVKVEQQYQQDRAAIFSKYPEKDRIPGGRQHLAFQSELEQLHLQHYLTYERFLDGTGRRGYYLEDEAAKQIVIDSWHHIAKRDNLIIYAICVMSNHVHVLLRARQEEVIIDYVKLMGDHKRWVATKVNELHGTVGRKVFSAKDFDRDVRSGRFASVLLYILKNPLKAGITKDWLGFSGNWHDSRLEQEFIQPYRIGLAA